MVEKDHYGKDFPAFKKGDLHTHTSFSRGNLIFDGALSPQELVEKAVGEGLDFFAIVDHDDVSSSFSGREHAYKKGLNIDVITGAEVSSRDGHILALGIETNIPFWMSASQTVEAIHKAGGKAIAAHPFFSLTTSVGDYGLRSVVEDENSEIYWDGIEVFNAGANDWRFAERAKNFWRRDGNRRARNFYTKEGGSGEYGAAVAGSDAHNKGVGRTVTIIPENMDIFTAIEQKETGVKIMDGREEYTFHSMHETKKRSANIEKERRAMPADARTFSLVLPSREAR